MESWKPEEKEPNFDMTPMIDVVFLLIAFFMTVASFITDEKIEIEIPEASEGEVAEKPGERINVSVKGNKIYAAAKEVSKEELIEILTDHNQTRWRLKVFLRADANARHKYVQDALEACALSGIFDVIFCTNQ